MTKVISPSFKKLSNRLHGGEKKYSVIMKVTLRGIINVPVDVPLEIEAEDREEAKKKALKFIADQMDIKFEKITRDDGLAAKAREKVGQVSRAATRMFKRK